MKQEDLLARHCEVLTRLSSLPKKMISIHGRDNVTEFLLHELCHSKCFNLSKAAYIINNPDFDCLKGVAGHCHEQAMREENIWGVSDQFSSHMGASPFNQKVRSFNARSLKRDLELQKDTIAKFAYDHGFKNHDFSTWNMKHDNQGFFIYEKANNDDDVTDKHLLNSLSLLSFCPVF